MSFHGFAIQNCPVLHFLKLRTSCIFPFFSVTKSPDYILVHMYIVALSIVDMMEMAVSITYHYAWKRPTVTSCQTIMPSDRWEGMTLALDRSVQLDIYFLINRQFDSGDFCIFHQIMSIKIFFNFFERFRL